MSLNPIKVIKEFRKMGYTAELSLDSARSFYTINLTSQNDVKRLTIPMSSVSIQELHAAITTK